MKKRFFAGLLALALTLGLAAPAGMVIPAGATASASDAVSILGEIAYYGDLSACRMTADQAEEYISVIQEKLGSFEIGYAALFDPGNGIPALYLIGGEASDSKGLAVVNGYEAVWQYDGGTAKECIDPSGYIYADLYIYPDCIFLYWGTSGMEVFELYPFTNGVISEAPSERGHKVDYVDYDPIYTLNELTVTKEEYDERFRSLMKQYGAESPYYEGAGPWFKRNGYGTGAEPSGVSPADTVVTALRSYAQALRLQDATPEEILAEIPYYGDRSKCQMTSAQAEAFVQTIEDLDIHEGMQAEYMEMIYSDIRVALCDVEGNGVPALLMYYRLVSPYPGAEWMGGELNVIVYLWENDQIREITELPSIDRTYGTAASEVFTSFGKNRFGGYGWSAWSRERAGAWQHNDVYYFKNGELQHSLCDEIEDLDLHMVTVSLDGVVKGVFSDTNGNEASALVQELIEQAGGPIAQDQEETVTIPVASAKSALRAYADAKKYPTYTYPVAETGDSHYADVTAAVAGQGAIQAVYKLLEDMYYVLLENSGTYSGAVVRGLRENGREVWRVTQSDGEPAAEDALTQLVNRLAGSTNLSLDFGMLRGSPELKDITGYLQEVLANIDGLAPNDPAKSDLAAFLNGAVASLASGAVTGKDNRLTIQDKTVSDLTGRAREAYDGLSAVLREASVQLNRTTTPVVRVLWSGVDGGQPCQLTLDGSVAGALDGFGLQTLLGNSQTYVQVAADDLSALTGELGTLSVQVFQEEPGVYTINFLNRAGEAVDRLSRPVTIGLPASGELSTVVASYAGGSDNWGGQYDAASSTLSFETSFSGRYEVLENSVAIDDLDGLSEESRTAIAFMVSKGYFSVEDGLFRPNDPLNRYELTEVLVNMFFALDRSLTTTFPDVPADSPYYAHVASAQARNIVNGIGDGTFSGESNITREQVFALAARTLIDQKGYNKPADADSYLTSFADQDAISSWARAQVALSVREGIAARGGALYPQDPMTREQAVVVLYRLFQLLYEVSPVALDMPEAASEGLPVPAIIGISVAVAAAAAGGAAFFLLRKKPKAAGRSKAL